MNARLGLLLLVPLLQADADPGDEPAVAPPRPALADLAAACNAGDWAGALAGAELLIDGISAFALSERELAEAHFARGLALARRELVEPSEEGFPQAAPAFASSLALAGPGRLRLDATYDLGAVHLLDAERWRDEIPEISGAAPGGSVPALPPAQPPAESEEDPLANARAAYLLSKGVLIQRLRADWRDADTRANLELIQRRLAELEEIERQREEQQQEQADQEQEGDQEGEGDQESESDEAEDPPEGDAEGEEGTSEDQEGNPDQTETGQGEQTTETQSAPRPEEGQGEAQSSGAEAERHLTREEVMRLLDKLAELEEEGEALEALLREARRVPVPRDW